MKRHISLYVNAFAQLLRGGRPGAALGKAGASWLAVGVGILGLSLLSAKAWASCSDYTGDEEIPLPFLCTDADEYEPGATASLFGFGFAAGETVEVQVLHPACEEAESSDPNFQAWEIVATEEGRFVANWEVLASACDSQTLRATATGLASGIYAERVFGDVTAPELAGVPADETAECDSIPDVAEVTATDDSGETPAVELHEANNVVAGCGTIVRTWTAVDSSGNGAAASQTIAVQDSTPPELVGVPESLLVSCDAIPDVADVAATDNCDPAPRVEYAETYNDVAAGCGTIVRTWTAIDACGNTASAEQTIDVEDTVPPELVGVPGDLTVACDAVPAPADVTATDNCGTGLAVVFSEEDVVVAGQRAIVRTWSVTDNCDGGTTTASQTITVNDGAAPTIVCPADLAVDSLPEPDPESVTATDDCGGLVAVTYEGDEVVQQDACSLVVRRTYRATDASGNSATCVQTITAGKPLSSTDAILWLPPLARKGMAEDTDPSAGGTLKYTFKAGCEIPVQVKVQSCGFAIEDSDRGHGHGARQEPGRRHHHDHPAVVAEVNLYADRNCDNLPDGGELPIKGNCKGGKGGAMEQVGDKFKFDLDTRSLTAAGCYVLEVVVTDVGTGQRQSERVYLKRK
jgi:hypothetical protein